MSSTQVPLWVPVIVALVGFIGVLGAQVVATWRDDRRWRREAEREELRWKRDRSREKDNRSYEDRQRAYAQVIGAVESFDWLMFPAYNATKLDQVVTDDMRTDLRVARDEAHKTFGPFNLHAPERIRTMLRDVMITRSTLAMRILRGDADPEDSVRLWTKAQRAYRQLRAEMRQDLGFDVEVLPGHRQLGRLPGD
jgi:hypothetical protein